METINIGKRWIVHRIMSYMKKYFTSISFENIQVEMLKGNCSFEELDINVKVLEEEFKLPFNIISGRIHNLKFELPWYKLLSNVDIQIETIEFEIKMKENEKFQNDEIKNTNKQHDLESAIEESSKELYIKKIVSTMIENLSISCNNVILKLVESDIVIRVDIKLFKLSPCNDDWRPNNLKEKSTVQWILKKMGKLVGISISMNKINKYENSEYYFEPLVLNMSLSIRFCCIFDKNSTVQPCLVQLDIFSQKIIISLMESHMIMITELLNLFKKYKSVNTKEKNNDKQRTISTSSTSKLTKESWKDLLNNWIYITNNKILTICQVLKIGIYIEELQLLLNYDVKKSLNDYKPLINTTCHGLKLAIVNRTLDILNVQFGISKILMNPEEDCTCGFKDCFNNQKSYFSSGKIQEDYLSHSLFQKHTSLNDENEFFFLYGSFEDKTSLKTTPSLALNYIIHQKLSDKHEISLETGTCVINLTLGLLHRFQFILKLLLDHYSSLFNAKPSSEKKHNDSLNKFPTQNAWFNFEMSTILIKILPICHAPSSYKNKQCGLIIDNFPEALIGIHKLSGSITIDKCTTCNNVEEGKNLKFNLIANKLEAKVYKTNETHSLLKINTIEWKKLESYCIENKSNSLLTIDNVKFESSKDNYLLFYYIIHSLITKSQCDKMYTDNCFINSELLQSNLDLVVLYWEIKGINIRCISQKQSSNFDITVKNVSADTIKLNNKNQFWSKIITLQSNKLGDIIHPILHIIVQIPSENDVTQMPLLFIKTVEIAINIDPLFFEWLVYAPDYRENSINSLVGLDNRVENDLSYKLPVEDQLENDSKRFHWFEKLKSTPVFIGFSAITLYFPNDIISIAEISFTDEKMDMKRWLEILSDHNIDILVMSISKFTINCSIDIQQIESYFDSFPVNFPESLWSNYDQSLFPWEINIKQLTCHIFKKKCLQSKIQHEIKVFDTFDVFGTLVITGTTKNYNYKELTHFKSVFDFHISKLNNIYVSEQQVKIVGALLKNITYVLRLFSYTSECNNKNDDIIFNTNKEDVNSKNTIENSLTVKTPEDFVNENNGLNQYSVTISVISNDINVIFFKNNKDNYFESSINICLYRPTMLFLSIDNFKFYQMVIYQTVMYTISYEKVLKTDELPKIKDSIVFFETNNSADSEEDMNFITIALCRSHKTNYPEIQINIERNMCFLLHKVTINTLLEVMNMLDQKNITRNTKITNNLFDVKNVDLNANLSKNNVLESSESNDDDDVCYQNVINHIYWTICIKSQKLSLKLFTEIEDDLVLNIENIYLQLDSVQKLKSQRSKQTYGKIKINNIAIFLNSFNSNELFLHSIQIVIKIKLPSSNLGPLQEEIFADLNVDYITLDLSQNRCKTILFIWNTYKYLFETKNNIALINEGPNIVPTLQISMFVVKAKINFLQDVKNIPLVRYNCVSEDLVKRKLLMIQLDEILIGLNFHKEGITTTVKSYVDFTLLSYEHLTEISIVKFLINFTSTHATNHKILNNQCNIKIDDIQCQMGPCIATLLNAAMDLWFSPSADNMPYIICNDTCFTIVLRQADTNENIVLNGLEYYNYSWLVSTEKPRLQFAIKNENHMSYWSEKLTLKSDLNNKYLTIKDSDGKDTILIITMQQTSPVSIKIVITSTLKLMNKTNNLLDALIITEKRNNYDQQDLKHILTVNPYEVTPSLMLEPASTFAVALRFSDLNNRWSDMVNVHNTSITKENTKSVLIKISKKVNFITTSNNVLCHFVFEEIDNFPQLLILLLPPFVICSYLPNNTMLNVSIVKSNNKTSINGIEVKSAIEQKNIQEINLPVITSDNDDDVDIILSISEDDYMSSIISVTGHILFENKTRTNMIHGIGDHLNNPYTLERTNLKWPFVGNRFDHVQWKSEIAQHKIRTTQTIQNYGVYGGLGTLTRLITIEPWALVVNTTGQSITLHSSTSVRCTLANMSVAVPTFADNNDHTFHIEINVEDNDRQYCSSAINFFDEQHLLNPDDHGNSTPMDGQKIIFANNLHSIAYLIATSSIFNGTKIVHLQSLYVATNQTFINLDVLLVCSMPTANLLNVSAYTDGLFVDLPRTSSSLGKPLALWTLVGSTTVRTAEFNQYLIIAWKGNSSCPIALRDVKISEKDEYPVPVVFSSFGPDDYSEPPSIYMTLQKHEDQHIITIHEQPYPQIVFYNLTPTSLIVTDSSEFTKKPTIRQIASDWYWLYEIMPGKTSFLSFPCTTLAVTLYFSVADGKSHTKWFASIIVDNDECAAVFALESNKEIEIRISRRAFTWDVVLYTTNIQNATLIKNLSGNNRAIESQFFVSCYIHAIVFTVFTDEFNLKKILTVVLNNIETTIQPVKNNINQDDIKLMFSINNIEIYNEMFYDNDFEYSKIISMKHHRAIDILSKKLNILEYLSQETYQFNKMDSALIIMFVIDKSSYSSPVILDIEVFLSIVEVFVEYKYFDCLLKYFKTFDIKPYKYEVENDVLEGLIPINILPLPTIKSFRTLRITPFQLLFNLKWSWLFDISMNHLRIKTAEFKRRNMQASLHQLSQCASIHYYGSVINNVGNAINSLELLGAPSNFICMAKKGFHDFVSMSIAGFFQGPKGFVYGLTRGCKSLAKHLSLGILLMVLNVTRSWSRTFNNFKSLTYIRTKIVSILKMVEIASKFCIEKIV